MKPVFHGIRAFPRHSRCYASGKSSSKRHLPLGAFVDSQHELRNCREWSTANMELQSFWKSHVVGDRKMEVLVSHDSQDLSGQEPRRMGGTENEHDTGFSLETSAYS